MTATPWNISGSASQLFFQDKQSAQYKALLATTHLPHPDRTILSAYINNAVDPEGAAQYFLHMTCAEGITEKRSKKSVTQFLSQWEILVRKFRPIRATYLTTTTKELIYNRDGGRCCLTRTPFKSYLDRNLEYVQIVSPQVLTDPNLSDGTALSAMLTAFLSRETIRKLRSDFSNLHCQQSEGLDTILLLSTQACDAVEEGEVFFTVQTWGEHPDTRIMQTYMVNNNMFTPQPKSSHLLSIYAIVLENRTPKLTPIVNEELLSLHARFSRPLACIEARKYIDMAYNNSIGSQELLSGLLVVLSLFSQFIGKLWLATLSSRIVRELWTAIPAFVRVSVYDKLLWVGLRIYGPSSSMTVYKLPFGLYLRRGSPKLAPKHHVEAHTLDMIQQLTRIPAPRAIDVLETPRFSYLLMTCVPGRPISPMLDSMTDEQIKQVVIDLKGYISELRGIPNDKLREFQICNSNGGGILDWRIPDSQQEDLRFKTEAEFNKYLTDPFWEDIRRRAAKSHDIRHDIVFTHGDLNPRNILVENGKITGIIDWENAGWFPEYWEYTKAHYTIRSLIRWLADVVDRVFEGYRDELVVENMLSDLLGPF